MFYPTRFNEKNIKETIGSFFAIFLLCGISFISCGDEYLENARFQISPSQEITLSYPSNMTCDQFSRPGDLFHQALFFAAKNVDEDQSDAHMEVNVCDLSFILTMRKGNEALPAGQGAMDDAVEKMVEDLHRSFNTNSIFHLKLTNGTGSYYQFEDVQFVKAHQVLPGRLKWATLGLLNLGSQGIMIRGYSRAKDDRDYKAMLNIIENLAIVVMPTNRTDAALIEASYSGNYDEVKQLLVKGANVDAVDSWGWTSLMYAAKEGHAKIALHLIDKDAGVNRRTTTDTGSTVLCFATEGNKLEVIEALLKRGADVNGRSKNGMTPLAFAAQSGFVEAAKLLISKGALVDLFGPQGEPDSVRSPLMCAALYGGIEMMELLLTNGAKIDLTNSTGNTALMLAAKRPRPEVLEFLIKNGAQVNARGVYGHTALIYAAYNGQVDNLRILLDAGADPFATATDAKDPNDGKARYGAADVAEQQGQFEALAIIRAAQARRIRL